MTDHQRGWVSLAMVLTGRDAEDEAPHPALTREEKAALDGYTPPPRPHRIVGWRGARPDDRSRKQRARERMRLLAISQLVGHLPLEGRDHLELWRRPRGDIQVRWTAEGRPVVRQGERVFHGLSICTLVYEGDQVTEYVHGQACRSERLRNDEGPGGSDRSLHRR